MTTPTDRTGATPAHTILILGGGPAAFRLVRALTERGPAGQRITVLMDEPHAPYDRVALEQLFEDPDRDLTLGDGTLWEHPDVTLRTGTRAVRLDREHRTVTDQHGETHPYDELVFATGSRAAVIPIPGSDHTHVFRGVDDVRAMVREVAELTERLGRRPRAVVVGGGLLGLEAAQGLQHVGADPTILDVASWLLSVELDRAGGHTVNDLIRGTGIGVECGAFISSVNLDPAQRVVSVSLAQSLGDESQVRSVAADLVVMAAGIRPNDELARDAGLAVGARGGITVDDHCRTEDPHVWAIGEVADILGRTWGLVAPANAMAEAAADNLTGGDSAVANFDVTTRLKFSGVEVADFGDRLGTTPDCLEVVYSDPVRGIYQKIVTSRDATTLLGGVFVGDVSPFDSLRPLLGRELPAEPSAYLSASGGAGPGDIELPDDAVLCSCNNVDFGAVRSAVDAGHRDVASLKACTSAGTQCGSCVPMLEKTLKQRMAALGLSVSKALCEHFEMSRPELYEAVRVAGLEDFEAVLARFGTGPDGCAVCKPTVASILHSQVHAYSLDGGRGTLQDTNDRNMANMQKDGTYSVIPRIPGGEITSRKLAALAAVGEKYGLYTKITGAQRIGLYGARLEQLPQIWRELVAAGFESGSAYGKALRNVKSCIGSSWCRFGVQDSVALAVDLENRYRGLRSPHKFKFGVSGCSRECAEAQGKDVGVIATTNGWNLFLGGNGGSNPAHGRLFAKDLTREELLRYVDRYLMYYIRTADRLQRTARWLEELDETYGEGMAHVRRVIVEDSLGICADLEAEVERHVAAYEDEWAATLADPARMRRFRAFVNEPEGDPADEAARMYVLERDQIRPATREEVSESEAGRGHRVLVSGARIPVGQP
ncbi:nitrite reductase large subunit NirB [Kocuria tytonis]|uniref:assimilatory sulfite reductase (ferredoxin) n=1 Tax=Kocuria tytonis TaxID=2054280 RepID=A0A495A9T8_9MICC|nr:nitrite reductase large subunit NirB [Kocuria tytonis]RKQ36533.1 nitrite reductase (NAD(P)H) [Kocuria tytonis]